MIDTFKAWAIDPRRSDDTHGFIGRYWWFDGKPPVISTHLEGCEVALFTTRAITRKHLDAVSKIYPDAKVVRVSVTVTS